MNKNEHNHIGQFRKAKIVGILRGMPAKKTLDIVDALIAGGINVIEVTANTNDAFDIINQLRDAFDQSELTLGAGTVLDTETAGAALRAGAEFIVAPNFNPEVVKMCNRYGAVVLPGVMTPTEAVNAYEAGADGLKVFPASTLGPSHIRSLKGPLPQLPLFPTGGISLENITAFISAGADGVGIGSSLVDSEAVAAENYSALTDRAAAFREAVESAQQ